MSSAVGRHETIVPAPVLFREGMEREQILAIGRLLISLLSLFLAGTHGAVACLIPSLYVLHSLGILIRVSVARPLSDSLVVLVQAFDVVWAALIFVATGQSFLLFVFALVAAAYRCRARETLVTAVAGALLLLSGTLLVNSSLGSRLRFVDEPLRPDTLAVQILGLLVLGGLLGYLADQHGQQGDVAAVADSILQNLHPEAGIEENLKEVLAALLTVFHASRAVVVLRDSTTGRGLKREMRSDGTGPGPLQRRHLASSEVSRYLLPMPGDSWLLARSNAASDCDLQVLLRQARRLKRVSCPLPANGLWDERFRTLWAVDLRFGNAWTGRVFLCDAHCSASPGCCLHFFQRLIAEVGPPVYNSYLWWRIRTRAHAIERKRIARDLHDGVIQELIGIEMHLDSLRRQREAAGVDAAETVAIVQNLIREEIRNLRAMIGQLRWDSPPRRLRASLAEIVEAFQRETGIAASFACDARNEFFSPQVSREVVHIVQEALSNVRKHSGARKVEVRLSSNHDTWQVVIQDDGRGFNFTGRLSQAELWAAREGPRIIQERVHCVKGELAIESHPDRGARLEIRFASNG